MYWEIGMTPDLVLEEVARRRDEQADGGGEHPLPGHLADIRTRRNQAVLKRDLFDAQLLGQLLGQQRAHDQAEAPVQEGGQDGYEGDQPGGLLAALGDPGQLADALLRDGRFRDRGAGDDDQAHLHCKGQQLPQTLVPVLNHLHRSLPRDHNAQDKRDEGQHDRKNTRVGHVLHRPSCQGGTYPCDDIAFVPADRFRLTRHENIASFSLFIYPSGRVVTPR